MPRREIKPDNGQMTLYGNKLIDDAKFTKTELIEFSRTEAKDLTEEQLVTRCQYVQYGICHKDKKGIMCKGICMEWFTQNIPLIMKLSNKVSDQLDGVGVDVAANKIAWLHSKALKECCAHVSLNQ